MKVSEAAFHLSTLGFTPTTDGSTAQVLSNDEGDVVVLVEMDGEPYIFVTYFAEEESTNTPQPVEDKEEIDEAVWGRE